MRKESAKAYTKLAEATREGVFVNIVDVEKAERVMEAVELMATHKKDMSPIVTDLTESAL